MAFTPSTGTAPRLDVPRLAWGRIEVISFSLAFWVGCAFAIRALF